MRSFAELANIGRFISLVGATGNAALGIYTIIDDPVNAPLAIFSLVFAPLAITDIVALSKAAGVRRGMSSDTPRAFGDVVNAKLDTITRIKYMCKESSLPVVSLSRAMDEKWDLGIFIQHGKVDILSGHAKWTEICMGIVMFTISQAPYLYTSLRTTNHLSSRSTRR